MSGDVTAAMGRLRAPIRTHDGDYHSWEWIPEPDDVLIVLAEVERLRAEREALHSDATTQRVYFAVDSTMRPGADVWDVVDKVMQALTADPEATQ